MSDTKTHPGIWTGQHFHFIALAVLLGLSYLVWESLDAPYPVAFWCAVAFPVAHQVYVWLAWRLELRSATVSKTIGLQSYVIVFFVLFLGRFASLLFLAWLDRGSLELDPLAVIMLTLLMGVPGVYAMYSVKRYFGMTRAAGADHFDNRYRTMPLVKKGIFNYTSNGMYLYAFFLFWVIAIALNSSAAIVVAAFSHAYIWVHFYATEKPDMDFIYGSENTPADNAP